jgi:cytochrome c553
MARPENSRPKLLATLLLATSLMVLAPNRVCAEPGPAADGSQVDGAEDSLFAREVAPILRAHCVRCHGEQRQESELRLDEAAGVTHGGQRGATLVAGQPAESLLWRVVAGQEADLQMPPEGPPLSADEQAALARWIEQGATWPANVARLEAPTLPEPGASETARNYWAFRSPQPTPSPAVAQDAWSRNDIDRFILQQARSLGTSPAPEADRRTLARRLYFDLIGQPPTWDEVQAFVQDDDPQAYERLVERLLERPEYGQRWARLWLDLVRYAESDGFKADVYRPHAWHFRDYVVRSLNADKPYDRFVQEQIAGDELFPDDMDARVATGYLRLWPLEDNQKDVERQWTLVLQDVTEVTSEAMLGLGLRCARCHDHKYDPISQRDYYRLQAFFAAMLPRDDLSIPGNGAAASLLQLEQQTQPIRREMRLMEQTLVASRKQVIQNYPPYLQAMYDRPPGEWSPLDHQYAYLARPQVEEVPTEKLEFPSEMRPRWDALRDDLQRQTQLLQGDLLPVMSVTDVGDTAPATHINQDPQRESVAPGFLTVLQAIEPTPTLEPRAGSSTGRRAALARWLTRPDHPLTARVLVNRIWQQYFGRGIVATPNDFGHQGTPPTHPELLDHLATEFVREGWSWKQLHRRIVTSATYRQGSLGAEPTKVEAEQAFCGRAPRRLDAEPIRDAMLRISGELRPYASAPSVEDSEPAPSIQLRNVRNRPAEWIFAFDGPDMFNSCGRRYTTTTPLQSLLVVNSPWALERAAQIARHIAARDTSGPATTEGGAAEDQAADRAARAAFREILAREPRDAELAAALTLWNASAPTNDADPLAPLTDLCHTLLCSNEFIYLD